VGPCLTAVTPLSPRAGPSKALVSRPAQCSPRRGSPLGQGLQATWSLVDPGTAHRMARTMVWCRWSPARRRGARAARDHPKVDSAVGHSRPGGPSCEGSSRRSRGLQQSSRSASHAHGRALRHAGGTQLGGLVASGLLSELGSTQLRAGVRQISGSSRAENGGSDWARLRRTEILGRLIN
jgi:hypothetical protein